MVGTNFFTPKTSTLDIALTDKNGYAVFAKCTGTPPTTAGIFLHGCILIQTDTTTGTKALYENVGSTAVPSWNLIGAIVAGELTLANTKLFVGGADNIAAEKTMSGDATLANTGAITIANDAVITAKIAANATTIAKVESALQKGIITVMMSFETAEQTATTIYFPYKVTINKIRGIVMKALGATDTGTITGANATDDSAGGVITGDISAALNTEYAETPTTNNVVLADGYYKLTSAKTTAGGKMLVTLEYTRTA